MPRRSTQPYPSRSVLVAAVLALGGAGHAAPCPRAETSTRAALDPLFDRLRLDRLDRLKAEFSEEKRIALLSRPLRQSGTIYFDRARGIARVTVSPRPERMVLTETTLRIEKGGKVEEIRLDQSKALKAFALVFPALLRGDRAALEAAFALQIRGAAADEWTLALTPRDPALCGLVARVTVSGRAAEVASLEVQEASGDTTSTRFGGIARNGAVPAAEVTRAFRGR